MIACVAGETHEIGTRMVADLLELAGWDTIYLGGNVPISDVVQVLVEHQADRLRLVDRGRGENLDVVAR